MRDEALVGLAEKIIRMRAMMNSVQRPLRVFALHGIDFVLVRDDDVPGSKFSSFVNIVNRLCERYSVRKPDFASDDASPLSTFERILAHCLCLDEHFWAIWPIAAKEYSGDLPKDPVDGYEIRSVKTEDGADLVGFAYGDPALEPLVIINPVGMPVDMLAVAFRSLSPSFRVITWEGRELSGRICDGDVLRYDIETVVADMSAVMDAFGVWRAHVCGSCISVRAAVKFAARCPERLMGLVLVNGSYGLSDAPKTPYELGFPAMMERVSGSWKKASLIQAFFERHGAPAPDEDCACWTYLPYTGPNTFFRYVTMCNHAIRCDIGSDLGNISAPTLVVSWKGDTIAHPAGSAIAAERICGARLEIFPGGSHMTLLDAPEFFDAMTVFLEEVGAG